MQGFQKNDSCKFLKSVSGWDTEKLVLTSNQLNYFKGDKSLKVDRCIGSEFNIRKPKVNWCSNVETRHRWQ